MSRCPPTVSQTGLGYQYVRSQRGPYDETVYIHQLTAIAGGADPYDVFSDCFDVHHKPLAREKWPDLLVVSNSPTWSGDDVTVASMTELLSVLVENRDRPKAVVFDEASRYMDSRTYSHEVSSQYTPFLKAGAKLGVQFAGHIGHTGKDVVPAVKRLTNLAFWKTAPTEVRFFNRWDGDSDRPSDPLFDADLTDLEPTLTDYDPDDVASWSWDLDPDVYADFRDWDHFADRLDSR